MRKNIGSADKIIRIVLAITIIALYFGNLIPGSAAIVLLIISSVLILTSFISFCPIYFPFGISTRKKQS